MGKQLVKYSLIGLAVLAVVFFIVRIVSFSNGVVDLRAKYEQKQDERSSFYSNMHTTVTQVTQITVKNDESFQKTVTGIMEGRKDSQDLMMKWITESNPNSNYSEVASMYRSLARLIESKRDELFIIEKTMQDVDRQHKVYIRKFPNSFINIFVGEEPFGYKPILSETGARVSKTGIETKEDIKLEL